MPSSSLFEPDIGLLPFSLSVAFLVVCLLSDIYAIAKLINIVRAIYHTRLFTSLPIPGGKIPPGQEPVVTIQICAYNESPVIEETIHAACSVDWPRSKLFVQICDDSNDETSDIVEAVSAHWRRKGVHCERLVRPHRLGYKAGNLHYNFGRIRGDFVALFDADHRIAPNFLRRAVAQFYGDNGKFNKRMALVQTPWAYYNTHQNLLTEYDALNLDVSHVIEQVARAHSLKCFGFNGTGGLWRKQAIEAGGGWQWDTLTEDLDLSYLVHMAGYEFQYLRDVPQELELPAGIRAHVQQKRRWTKGFMQVARKSLWNVIRSPESKIAVKVEAIFHFTNSFGYVFALLIVLMAPAMVYYDIFTIPLSTLATFPVVPFLLSSILTVYAKTPSSNDQYKGFWDRTMRLFLVPLVSLIGMGMTVFETTFVIDGLLSNDATFHRTPKKGAGAAKANQTASIIDYLNPDTTMEMDEDGSENEPEAISEDHSLSDASTDSKSFAAAWRTVTTIGSAQDKKKCAWSFPRKYMKDLMCGVLGLGLVAYFLLWATVLWTAERFKEEGMSSFELAQQCFVLAPVPGLLYIHGSFVTAMLGTSISKFWKSRFVRRRAEW